MAKQPAAKNTTAPAAQAKAYEAYTKGTAAALDKAIVSIKARSAILDEAIHLAGVGCIGRSLPHEAGGHLDATRALKLVEALSPGQSRLRLVAWLHHFSNIRVTAVRDTNTKAMAFKVRMVKPGTDEFKELDASVLDKAMATPFWALNEEAAVEPKQFDSATLARMLENLVKAHAKAKEAGHVTLLTVEEKMVENLAKMAKTQKDRAAQVAKQAGAAVMKVAAEKHVDPLTVIENVRKAG